MLPTISILGPVRARLEPPRSWLPAAARVPQLDLGDARAPRDGHPHHILLVGVRPRARHGVHLPKAARVPVNHADVPVAARAPQPNALAPGTPHPR